MNTIKNTIIAAAMVFGAGLVSCVESNQVPAPGKLEVEQPQYTPDALEGELLVKFSPAVASVLEQAGVTKSGEKAPLTRSGILSIDEILDLVDGYWIERVFPVDPRTEDQARKAGFDLWYVVRFSKDIPVQEVAERFSRLGEVNSVQFNCQLHRADYRKAVPLTKAMVNALAKPTTTFNDPLSSRQWDLVNEGCQFEEELIPGQKLPEQPKFVKGADVGVKEAWKLSKGHPSIIVAVVDEGVDVFHEDLKTSMWVNEDETYGDVYDNDGNGYAGDRHGYNFADQTGVISTGKVLDSGHGTHVAGVIAAKNNNGKGISSIAGGDTEDNGVKIMSCQIFSGDRLGTVLDEVRAIKYAADNGAVILQCSWGYVAGTANGFDWQPQFRNDEEWKKYSPLEFQALDYFIHTAGSPDGVVDGGIAVFAAGNESAPSAGYPGAYPKFVSVASTAADFTPSVFTNYGPGTTISAPGGDFDYYYEYGDGVDRYNTGAVGAILSTIPAIITGENGEMTGYGYMEGTSMACPHVSGVIALGLSYAAEQHKHFKAQDVINVLYRSVTPIDEVMKGEKTYYKYVADLGFVHKKQLELTPFKGQMGGQVNAFKFLQNLAGAEEAVDMVFPNVLLEVGKSQAFYPSYYGDFGNFQVTVENAEIAKVEVKGDQLIFTGLRSGQTKAVIKGAKEQSFVITVRDQNVDNGWM